MAGDNRLFQEIKNQVDILSYAQEMLPGMKRVGRSWESSPAPCCSHKDCFRLEPQEQFFKCWSCDTKGDVIVLAKVLENHARMIDAAKSLVNRYGLSISADDDEGWPDMAGARPGPASPPPPKPAPPPSLLSGPKETPPEKDPWLSSDEAYAIRKWAADHYHANLVDHPTALAYQTEQRKHDLRVLKKHRIGIGALKMIKAAKADGIAVEDLIRVGLAQQNTAGAIRETVSRDYFVYPHFIDDRPVFFTIKPMDKQKKNFQIKKQYAPEEWICLNQAELTTGNAPLIILEGENDLLSVLHKGGYPHVIATNASFNAPVLKAAVKKHARGRSFILLFDISKDDGNAQIGGPVPAGRRYTQEYGRLIKDAGGTATVGLVPGEQDIDDFLKRAERPVEALQMIIDNATPAESFFATPAAPPPPETPAANGPENLFAAFGFEVLCETPDGAIAFWNPVKRCTYVRPIKDLDMKQLVQIGGQPVMERVVRSKEELGEGCVLFNRFIQAVIVDAGNKRMSALDHVGLGIHRLPDPGKWLFVNGRSAWIYDLKARTFTRQAHPLCSRKMINFSADYEIIDMKRIEKMVAEMTPEGAEAIYRKTLNSFKQWGFKGEWDPEVLTGWVLAQPLQDIWDWRPNVAFYGQPSSGKSRFHRFIQAVYSKPFLFHNEEGRGLTEPALRQTIGPDKCLVYIDEFEKNPNREKIIYALRSSSGGGSKRIGSSTQKSTEFTYRHMIMISATVGGGEEEAEGDRFLTIETAKDDRRKPDLPSTKQADDLRHEWLAYAFYVGPKALSMIRENQKGMTRGQEAMAVPLSMITGFIEHEPSSQLMAWIRMYQEDVETRVERVPDTVALMDAILGSKLRVAVRVSSGMDLSTIYSEPTISQLLNEWDQIDPEHHKAMVGVGIRMLFDEDSVFFYPPAITRHLLKNVDRWSGENLKMLMGRYPGAKRIKRDLDGRKLWGFKIPLKDVLRPDGDEEVPF